jgi:hypothetical protein
MTVTDLPPTENTNARPASLAQGTAVEVRSSLDHRWSSGFEIITGDDTGGYVVRRMSDGAELPRTFAREELRRERERRRGGQWWY